MHARIMLVTSEMNKKSVEIVTECCPRLPGRLENKSYIKIGELFHVYCRISIETDNHVHFESNAASATDKKNDMRHIPHGTTHQVL